MTSIDKLDVEILDQLTTDARRGVAEIAAGLGVSRNTVHQRMRRLTEEGVLRGFVPNIDLAAIGMPVQAYVSLELDQRQLQSVIGALAEMPHVLEVKTQAGREDLLVSIAGDSLQAIQDLTTAMVNIEGVRHTTTTLTVSTPVPHRVQPLLEYSFEGTGWGRSTPLP